MCVKQLEEGRAEVENQYARAVRREGNVPAQQLVRRGVRGRATQVARRRRDPASGLGLAPGVSRRSTPRRGSPSTRRTADEPAECMQRPDPAGAEEAARVPGVRHALHAGAPARRDDGVVRRGVRRLLPLPSAAARPVGREELSMATTTLGFRVRCPSRQHARVLLGARRRRTADQPAARAALHARHSATPRSASAHDGARARRRRRSARLHHRLLRRPAAVLSRRRHRQRSR